MMPESQLLELADRLREELASEVTKLRERADKAEARLVVSQADFEYLLGALLQIWEISVREASYQKIRKIAEDAIKRCGLITF